MANYLTPYGQADAFTPALQNPIGRVGPLAQLNQALSNQPAAQAAPVTIDRNWLGLRQYAPTPTMRGTLAPTQNADGTMTGGAWKNIAGVAGVNSNPGYDQYGNPLQVQVQQPAATTAYYGSPQQSQTSAALGQTTAQSPLAQVAAVQTPQEKAQLAMLAGNSMNTIPLAQRTDATQAAAAGKYDPMLAVPFDYALKDLKPLDREDVLWSMKDTAAQRGQVSDQQLQDDARARGFTLSPQQMADIQSFVYQKSPWLQPLTGELTASPNTQQGSGYDLSNVTGSAGIARPQGDMEAAGALATARQAGLNAVRGNEDSAATYKDAATQEDLNSILQYIGLHGGSTNMADNALNAGYRINEGQQFALNNALRQMQGESPFEAQPWQNFQNYDLSSGIASATNPATTAARAAAERAQSQAWWAGPSGQAYRQTQGEDAALAAARNQLGADFRFANGGLVGYARGGLVQYKLKGY